jgi:hypothetical protein
MAPRQPSHPLLLSIFWHGDGPFLPKTITVDILDNTLDDSVKKGIYFSTFLEFLAASNPWLPIVCAINSTLKY